MTLFSRDRDLAGARTRLSERYWPCYCVALRRDQPRVEVRDFMRQPPAVFTKVSSSYPTPATTGGCAITFITVQ